MGTYTAQWIKGRFGVVLAWIVLASLASSAHAATGVPKILQHQGRLLDSSGNLLGGSSGTDFCFKFSFYDDATVGSPDTKLWPSGTPSTMTVNVKSGVFSVGIGDTAAGGDTLDFNFQDNDTIYLNAEVASKVGATCAPGDGAESFENLAPRQRIVASGYAINAATVGGFTPSQSPTGSNIPVLTSGNLLFGGAVTIDSGGTGALNLGTGANAKTVTIGNTATTTTLVFTKGSSGNITLSGFNCTTFTNGGALTTDASGNIVCSDDNGGAALTVRESDTSPSISSVSTLEFGPAATSSDEFIVTDQTGGVARVRIGDQVGMLNQAETVTGGWTFGTATTTFSSIITASGGLTLTGATNINTSGATATNIGTGANTGTITIGNASGGDLVLNDAQWSVTGAGVASFATTTIGALSVATTTAPTGGVATFMGNVGIGTTGPGTKLDVIGNTTGIIGRFTQSGSWTGSNYALSVTGYTNLGGFRVNGADAANSIYLTGAQMGFSVDTGQVMTFGQWNGATTLERVRIADGGNVGIGDASPAALLTVGSGDLFQVISTGEARGIAGAVGAPSFSFTGDTNTGMYSGGADILRLATAGADRVTVDASGNVGIATTTPSEKLHVIGNAIISATLTTNTITPTAAMTIGSTSQNLTLQGSTTTLTSAGTNNIVLTPGGEVVVSSGNLDITASALQLANVTRISNAGAGTFVGVDAGTGLLQGTGGLTLAGAASVNTSGSNATNIGTGTNTGTITIGNASGGDLALADPNWSVTGAGVASLATTTVTVLVIGGDTLTELVGTGLAVSGTSLTTSLGTSIETGEITDATITGDDIATSIAGAGLVLTAATPDTLDIGAGFGITVNANDIAIATSTAFTWGGLHTFNATTTFATSSISAIIIAGDTVTDFTGTGLAMSGTTLTTTLGTSIESGEITDATITGDDIASSIAGAGLVLTAATPDTLDIGAGFGITVNANDIAIATSTNITWGGLHTFNATTTLATTTVTALTATSVTSPTYTSSAGLTIDSGNNTITIAGSDTTLSRTAAGTFTIDLVDGATTKLAIINSGAATSTLQVDGLVNCDSIDTDASGNLVCGADAGAGASPFSSAGGVITKATATDFLSLRYGDAADVQIQIENTTAGTIPTADAMQIDLSGGTTGIVTAGVDGLFILMEVSDIAAGGTISGINVDIDTVGTPTANDTYVGLNIAALNAATAATENAIQIGGTWDVDITSADGTDLNISAGTTGDVVLNLDADTPLLFAQSAGGTDITTAAGEALTIVPGGAGDVVINTDADTNLQITATAAPAVDLVAITNSGQGVTTTTGVDGLAITYVQATDAAAITGSALDISVTQSGDASDTIRGITINNITGGVSTEEAISIGSGWDAAIKFVGASDLDILDNSATALTVSEGANVYLTFDTTNAAEKVSLGVNLALSGDANEGLSGGGLADCDASNQRLQWDSTTNKFSCLTVASGAPDTATFTDTTPAAPTDADTTEIFDDATRPNITPDSTANTVLVSVAVKWTSGGINDTLTAFRIVRENDSGSTVPSCDGTDPQVGGTIFGGFTTAASQITGGSASFIDSPATTTAVYFTVCSSADAVLGSAPTMNRVEVSLVELGADLAENYYTLDDSIGPGDVVAIDVSVPAGVKKASTPYDGQVVGVVSTAPGIILDDAIGLGYGRKVPVALAGRIPVKVSIENGRVKAGDLLTSSSVPGVAMKATKAGPVIGQALHDFGYPDGEIGLVTVLVKNSYSHGTTAWLLPDGLSGETSAPTATSTDWGKQILTQLINQQETASSTPSEILTDRLAAGLEVISPRGLFDGLEVNSIGALADAITITSDTIFFGRPYFSADTAGLARITTGSEEVAITFEREYLEPPVVTVSMEADAATGDAIFAGNLQFALAQKTTKGFAIRINKPAHNDITFNWIALAVKNAKVFGTKTQQGATASTAQTSQTTYTTESGTTAASVTTQATSTEAATTESGESSTQSASPSESTTPQSVESSQETSATANTSSGETETSPSAPEPAAEPTATDSATPAAPEPTPTSEPPPPSAELAPASEPVATSQ